jgi:hypothetical protein
MITLYKTIGTHSVEFSTDQQEAVEFIEKTFSDYIRNKNEIDINIKIVLVYGSPFVDYDVTITKTNEKITFRRSDYLIETDHNYSSAIVFAHNELALKHALMNLYSSYIVYHNWGLLMHSSCAIEDGKAHIFSGHSGAGKSTVAKLSRPRPLLSDEATLVKITPVDIQIYDSPFRSEITESSPIYSVPLHSIQILYQSLQNNRTSLKKADALINLMDKIFYWAHNSEETKKVMKLLRILVDRVPTYDLYFKKDQTFWELIS